MKSILILFGLTFGLLQPRLVRRGLCQSLAGCGALPPLEVPGYTKGQMFLKKQEVFQCTKLSTNIVYVCKVQKVVNRKDTPMEAQVFDLITKHHHANLPAMHELINLASEGRPKTFVEVIEYLKPSEGWMNLHDFILQNYQRTSLKQMISIFRQIVDGIVHLFALGISHSDLKGNGNIINIRVERYD
jgi:serine/threonine protein kinase